MSDDEIVSALESLRRQHYECEDCWYSCPKSVEGCCDDDSGDECLCGADKDNATIDALLAAVVSLLEKDSP